MFAFCSQKFLTPLFLFTAFLLLLLVSLSLPIITPIYLFQISAILPPDTPKTDIATVVRFGLWGYCGGGYEFGVKGLHFVYDSYCSKAKVGYDMNPILLQLLNGNIVANILLKSLPYVLIMHPVACFLTLLTVIPSVLRFFIPQLPPFVRVATLLIALMQALVTTVVFAIDIVLVVVARQKVDSVIHGTLGVFWGDAVWMTGLAMACLWMGVLGLSAFTCGCCGLERKWDGVRASEKEEQHSEEKEEGQQSGDADL